MTPDAADRHGGEIARRHGTACLLATRLLPSDRCRHALERSSARPSTPSTNRTTAWARVRRSTASRATLSDADERADAFAVRERMPRAKRIRLLCAAAARMTG